VPRVKAKGGEALGEATMPMGAQLDQQEAGTAAKPLRRGRLRASALAWHAADGTARLELFML